MNESKNHGWAVTLGLACALGACGGNVDDHSEDRGGTGGTAELDAAGPPAGGAGGRSSNSTGGARQPASGGTPAIATGGSGGRNLEEAAAELCSLPPVTGPCYAAFQRFFYNPASAACEPFTYGGCGGNANNFDSLLACNQACAARADFCRWCDDKGCLEEVDCSVCPLTRDSHNGKVCDQPGISCTYVPACGATQCHCTDHNGSGLVWECLENLC